MSHEDDDLSHHGVDEAPAGGYANPTLRLLLERSSCRSFRDQMIPEEALQLVLDAGNHAPTGGNLQPYSIIKVENRDTKKKLAELNEDQVFIETAPVDLIFCIDWHRIQRWAELEVAPFTATKSFRHFWISFQDTIIAAQNICTAADAVGLGSVYVGTIIDRLREHRELLRLPDGVFPVVLLSLGYPKVRPGIKKKLGVKAIVHSEVYRESSDDELHAMFEEKYPGWRKEATPERIAEIARVCLEVHGEQFAERCAAEIKRKGHINAVQNYFGLHYQADLMPQGNSAYLSLMREFGFEWFEQFVPPKS